MGGFFFLILLVVIGGIVFSMHQSKQLDDAWGDAARRLGMFHDPGGLLRDRRLTGTIGGFRVVVESFTRGSGKSSSKYTRYRIHYPHSLGMGLHMRRQGVFAGLARAFGAQDIVVGDPKFDEIVIVKGRNQREVVDFLTAARREWVRRVMMDFDDVTVDDEGVQSESSGYEKSSQILVNRVRRLMEFAQQMVVAPPPIGHEVLPVATPVDPVIWLHEPPPAPPPLPVVPLTQWQQAEPELESYPPERTESILEENATETRGEAWFDAAQVGARLFGTSRGISEVDGVYVAEFADRLVVGNGVLRSAKTTHFDFLFGSGPYIKATVDLPLASTVAGGHHTFQIILRLPEDTKCPQSGDSIAFQGRMMKVDGLMRQLFVAGELVRN